MALLDRAIVSVLPAVPKGVVRRISSRYIAGTDVAGRLPRRGSRLNDGTGRWRRSTSSARRSRASTRPSGIAREYRYVFETIEREQPRFEREREARPRSGLNLSYSLCRRNLEQVVSHAAEIGNFVRIDMEDSSTTDDTLRALPRAARGRARQRRRRSPGAPAADARRRRGARRPDAERPALQGHLRRAAGRSPSRSSRRCGRTSSPSLDALLEAGSYVGIATHDEWLLEEGKRLVGRARRERDEYEFQMLLGVRSGSATRSSPRVTGCGSTCPTASTGTRTRCAACRRTRRSRATSPRTRSGGSCPAGNGR